MQAEIAALIQKIYFVHDDGGTPCSHDDEDGLCIDNMHWHCSRLDILEGARNLDRAQKAADPVRPLAVPQKCPLCPKMQPCPEHGRIPITDADWDEFHYFMATEAPLEPLEPIRSGELRYVSDEEIDAINRDMREHAAASSDRKAVDMARARRAGVIETGRQEGEAAAPSLDTEWQSWLSTGGAWDVVQMARFIERLWHALEAATQSAPAVRGAEPPALQHIIAFCEQVARDGILPSLAWFQETADTLRSGGVALPPPNLQDACNALIASVAGEITNIEGDGREIPALYPDYVLVPKAAFEALKAAL